MKRSLVFLLLLLFVSCEYFNVKKTSSETILNEELKTFNWNEVDEFPSFETCSSVITKLERKYCFEHTLTQEIISYLQHQEIVVSQDVNDTLYVDFAISELGKLSLLDIKVDSLTVTEIPEIKNYISESLKNIPKILPAIKRGQHVKTQFKLPLIIAVD